MIPLMGKQGRAPSKVKDMRRESHWLEGVTSCIEGATGIVM